MQRSQDHYQTISNSLTPLRGVAILWIVGFHLLGFTKGYSNLAEIVQSLAQGGLQNSIEYGLRLLFSTGDFGVSIFITISGFGLAASWWKVYGMGKRQRFSFREFWVRRFSRIFPLFWASIVLATLLYAIQTEAITNGKSVWNGSWASIIGAFLATITTLRNFIPQYYYFLNGAWWYVGLAVQLYLVFPFLMNFGRRWGWTKLLIVVLLVSLAYRSAIAIADLEGTWRVIAFNFFPAKLFSFTLGSFIAIRCLMPLSSDRNTRIKLPLWLEKLLFNTRFLPVNLACFAAGVVCQTLAENSNQLWVIPEEALVALGLFCGLVCLVQVKIFALIPFPNLVSRYSYGIYLTHMPIGMFLWLFATRILPSYWLRFVVVILVCCSIGVIFEFSYNWLQQQWESRISGRSDT